MRLITLLSSIAAGAALAAPLGAQAVPQALSQMERIDVSRDFGTVSTYNGHIRRANDLHYRADKKRLGLVFQGTLGLGAAAFGLANIHHVGSDEDDALMKGVMAGGAIGLAVPTLILWPGKLDEYQALRRAEANTIAAARRLFPQRPVR